jgi:uncharacterized protein (DUF697 family)
MFFDLDAISQTLKYTILAACEKFHLVVAQLGTLAGNQFREFVGVEGIGGAVAAFIHGGE